MNWEWEYPNKWSLDIKADYKEMSPYGGEEYAPDIGARVIEADPNSDGKYIGFVAVQGHMLFCERFATPDGAKIKLEAKIELAKKGHLKPKAQSVTEPIDYTKIGRDLYQNGK